MKARIVHGALLAAAWVLTGCGNGTPPRIEAASATLEANRKAASAATEDDAIAAEDAVRGLIARPSGRVLAGDGRILWDFDAFAFLEGEPPPTANPLLWRHSRLTAGAGLFKVADGIYQIRGFDIANLTLVEGKSGWIVVDTLTTRETASAAMAFASKHLGDRPVSAIVFTHSHVDHFGGALGVISAAEVTARGVPVVAPEGFLEEATSENILLGPAMGRRAMYMYGALLPRSATGAIGVGLGQAVAMGAIGILPPNRIVSGTPQEMSLDGVRFVFQNVPASEAPAELTFYLPERKVFCGAELASHTMHNLYTPRGAKVRDALRWSGYLDEALRLFGDAEVFLGQHQWPVWGNARIVDFLKKHRDLYRYLHDQSVRLINAGFTPREIAEQIRLPRSLAEFAAARGHYGTLRQNAKAVYQLYMGWFDGNPANLDPLPPEETGKRYVALAGGVDQIIAAARSAFDGGEYRWAAELLNHAVFAQPGRSDAKELLARAYEQLGFATESAPWRNFYLTGALELRNGTPKRGIDRTMVLDMLAHTSIERFLEAMAASLNGPAADGKNFKINLVFTDLRESYVLWIENAVLHHRASPPASDANATMTLSKPFFLKMMMGSAGAKDLLLGDQIEVSGSRIDLIRFFSLFAKAAGVFAIVTP